MPASIDTSQYLEALAKSAVLLQIENFAARHKLEAALCQRIFPIFGTARLGDIEPELLPVVMHLLQVASLYPYPLDVTTPEYA